MKRRNNLLFTLIALCIFFLTPTHTSPVYAVKEDTAEDIEELVKESQEYKDRKENKEINEKIISLTKKERKNIRVYLEDKESLNTQEKIVLEKVKARQNDEDTVIIIVIGFILCFLLMFMG